MGGVGKDEEKAVKFFRRAAEKGHKNAQYNLGVLYSDGRGIGVDKMQAILWFVRAAKEEQKDAKDTLQRLGGKVIDNIGSMFRHGVNVPLNLYHARELFIYAAARGYAPAAAHLAELEEAFEVLESLSVD